MSGRDDIPGDVGDDLEKFQRMRQRDADRSLGALAESAFAVLTGVVALGWLATLWWVPDVVPGQVWLGAGMIALAVVGLPAAAIRLLRRGGVRELLRALE